MPFKSEKQRRFLWAEHPDIAKRWAKEYPESNKNLPMYAHPDKKDDKKPSDEDDNGKKKVANFLTELTQRSTQIDSEIGTSVKNCNFYKSYNSSPMYPFFRKFADSKQEVLDIPHSDKPTYAGEERAKGEIKDEISLQKNVSGDSNGAGERKPENAINSLLQKISVVLSPHVEQTMENLQAEREGRVPRRVGRNRGIKHYPVATPAIMPPMGMQQAPAQASAQNTANRMSPVGGGSHPQFNPINSFGGLSTSGVLNGNAAFGAKNSPDSSKIAQWLREKLGQDPVAAAGSESTGPTIPDWIDAKYHEGLQGAPGGRKYMYFPHADNLPEAGGRVVETETGSIVQSHIPDREAYTKYLMNGGNADPKPLTFGAPQTQQNPAAAGAQPAQTPAAPAPPAIPKPAAPQQAPMTPPASTVPKAPAVSAPSTPKVPQAPKPPTPASPPPIIDGKIKTSSRSEALGKLMDINNTNPEDVEYLNEEYEEELAGRKAAASTTLQADPLATYEAEMARQHGSPAHNLWLELSGMFDDDAESGKHDYNDPQARAALIAKHKQLMADEQAHKTFLNERATFHANADNKLQALLKGAAADALEHDLPAEKKPTQGPSLLTTGLVGAGAGLGAFGLSKALEANGYSPSKLVQPYLPAAPEWLKNLGTKLEDYMTPKNAKDNKTRANTPCFSAAVEEKQGAWPAVLALAALETALSAGSYAWGRHDGWTAAQPTTAQKVTPYVLGGLAGTGLGVLGYHAMDKFKKKKPPQPVQEPKLYSPEEPEMAQKYSADKKCSCGCGDTVNTCKCSSSCSCKKPGGSCYKSEKNSAAPFKNSLLDAQVPGYKERVARAASLMDKLMGKNKKLPSPVVKAGASSPAWQRSEGKNEEGGLNEKGRKSYEREHGGNLKAPVTQKNPKGEAKKRQNSFCSRMCGMKRVNTGASTAKDPDSRINKSLRKWNCKCSSAIEFGALVANHTCQFGAQNS